jgi:D-alanyl-D-alanine endopeptidase (penicillin-binding protein 7)
MKRFLLGLTLAVVLASNAEAGKRTKTTKKVPEFSAKSFIVADSNGHILKEKNSDDVRPIASITKLIIGMIVVNQNMYEKLEIPSVRTLRTTIPRKVDTLTREDLLTLALVKSDNFATEILCANIPNCIDRMNLEAHTLQMNDTHFEDPTGLSNENVSTATDLLKLLLAASNNAIIRRLSSMESAEIEIGDKSIKVKNTNPLVSKLDVVVSKTGTTQAAGGCLVMVLNSSVGQRILILLGSRSGKTRITDMEKLIKGL